MLNKVILGVSGSLLLVLLVGIKVLDTQKRALEAEVSSALTKLNVQTQRAEALELAAIRNFKEAKAFETQASKIQQSYSKDKRELLALRNRESVVLARPTLVSIKINKAYTKRQEELACLTGDLALCKKP